jgi:hypothetical protein
MNFDAIETQLVADLQRALGSSVDVLAGPEGTPPLGGMQPTVFMHAALYEDAEGAAADGAQVARQRVRDGRFSGYVEQRLGRVSVAITCVASAYQTGKALATIAAPRSLLSLSAAQPVPAGQLLDGSVRLMFADFSASIARAESFARQDGNVRYHAQRIELHLDGFLHMWVTASGGLRRPAPKVVAPQGVKTRSSTAARG